ncbi:MAG: tRNA (adenosine(37)-N6)-threonylcarbamoyltransferase complex dimerization subunit type 1 TsaB [Bacteroidetes bacterium]|nr:tRNA (adenosine(37)-N6)-threonylcarbamoyltransferase complex dimerization subunit type 1 TsaB [Bacteroidota bacterium]
MTTILHIDTSTDLAIILLEKDGKVASQAISNEGRNHAANINLMIEQVCTDAGLTFKDLSAVSVVAGPGSYTGLRIGLASAKGLCYALDLPLIMHNKLTLLALEAREKTTGNYSHYLSVIIARDKEYFVSLYNNMGYCVKPPQHLTEEALLDLVSTQSDTLIIGNLPSTILSILSYKLFEETIIVSNNFRACYDFVCFSNKEFADLYHAEPFYLKGVFIHKSL